MGFYRDLRCDSPHAQWGGDSGQVVFQFWGVDWSAASFKFVAAYRADNSQAFAVSTAAAGSEGLSATHTADAVHPVTGAEMSLTTVVLQVNESKLEGLTYEGVADLVLTWTLFVTPSGLSQFPYGRGNLTIVQGAPD